MLRLQAHAFKGLLLGLLLSGCLWAVFGLVGLMILS